MASFAKHMVLCHANMTNTTSSSSGGGGGGSSDHHQQYRWQLHQPARHRSPPAPASDAAEDRPANSSSRRWTVASSILTASAMLGLRRPPPPAQAEPVQSWGTRSFIKEKYFQPGLSPEEAVARIRQTAEGLQDMRHMLDTMSWRYVMFYIRLKSAYLDADLKTAISTVPEGRRSSYIKTANELVDNMSELDRYVRSPKVYESYVYYEKTLKSLDELLALFA